MISLTLYGQPVAKGRARTVRTKSGHSVTYTPDKTAQAESQWRYEFLLSGQAPMPEGAPLSLTVRAYFARPKSLPKKRLWPVGKPDIDNLVKLIADALEGLAWVNDSAIVDLQAQKRYAVYPDLPRVEIEVSKIGSERSLDHLLRHVREDIESW